MARIKSYVWIELHQLVKDYFAMENLGVKIPEKMLESKEVQRANKILETTTVKKGERYTTGLLWKLKVLHIHTIHMLRIVVKSLK